MYQPFYTLRKPVNLWSPRIENTPCWKLAIMDEQHPWCFKSERLQLSLQGQTSFDLTSGASVQLNIQLAGHAACASSFPCRWNGWETRSMSEPRAWRNGKATTASLSRRPGCRIQETTPALPATSLPRGAAPPPPSWSMVSHGTSASTLYLQTHWGFCDINAHYANSLVHQANSFELRSLGNWMTGRSRWGNKTCWTGQINKLTAKVQIQYK